MAWNMQKMFTEGMQYEPPSVQSTAPQMPTQTAPSTQTFPGWATTATGASTPAYGSPTSNFQDFYDVGLNIEGGGNMKAPTIYKSDFTWQPASGGEDYITIGSGDAGYQTVANPAYVPAGVRLSDAARARLADWAKNDPTSIAWGFNNGSGSTFDDFFYGYDWNNPTDVTAMVKSGDKSGTGIKWVRNGDALVPVGISNARDWNTNNDHTKAAMAFGGLLSMGLAGPAALGAQATGGGVLGSGLTMGQLGFGANLANFATGGRIPGLREVGLVTGLANGVSGLSDAFSSGLNNLSDVANLAKSGYNVYSKGSKLMDMFSDPAQQYPYGGGGMRPPSPYTTEATSGGTDFSGLLRTLTGAPGSGQTGLMDLYGAYKGSKEARDEAFRLQDLYNAAQARRQPVLDRLNESYTNPDSFYNSNQWKGLSSVYQNSIDRKAAAAGRLSNPTDREVLMQQHAMKALEDYRSGLRDQVGKLNPDNYINPFMRGSTREANAANPYFALGGRGSVGAPGMGGGDAYQYASQIAKVFGGFDKIPGYLKQVLGLDGSDPNYGGGGANPEMDFPMSDPTVDWGMGSFNPDEYGVDLPGSNLGLDTGFGGSVDFNTDWGMGDWGDFGDWF